MAYADLLPSRVLCMTLLVVAVWQGGWDDPWTSWKTATTLSVMKVLCELPGSGGSGTAYYP